MDGLGWDLSQIVKSASSLWSNQHEGTEESLIVSNSNYCLLGAEMDLPEDFFSQVQAFQKAQTSQLNPISERCQEAKKSVENAMMPGSKELYSSSLFNMPCAAAPCTTDSGLSNQSQSQATNGLPNGSKGGSSESLDCLLSATKSNTNTSVKDDGISVVFSDCRNLWNFGANSAVSSTGESGNNACIDVRNKEVHCPVSDIDGTVSKSSSNQYASQGKCSQPKPASTETISDQNELKLGADYPNLDNLQTACSTMEDGFRLISENPPRPSKKVRLNKCPISSNINFQQPHSSATYSLDELDLEAIAQMKEMMYQAAVFRPVNLGLEVIEKPQRKNVRISSDPQTVAARQRRERISERIRLLQRLVPGGSKMDTASMLDEAANYLKFLRSQVKALENIVHKHNSLVNCPPTTNIAFSSSSSSLPFNHPFPMQTHFFTPKPWSYSPPSNPNDNLIMDP